MHDLLVPGEPDLEQFGVPLFRRGLPGAKQNDGRQTENQGFRLHTYLNAPRIQKFTSKPVIKP
jgi:hypothetical protein